MKINNKHININSFLKEKPVFYKPTPWYRSDKAVLVAIILAGVSLWII